jgi:mRNA interferase MazF
MENLSVGQIVLASFPFSDLSSKKLRPCYIVGVAEFDDVILCQITSQRYDSIRAIDLQADDFIKGNIIRKSYIKPDKIATLDKKTIKQVLGVAKDTKVTEVKKALSDILEIS